MRDVMVLFNVKPVFVFLLCAVFCTSCDLPPEEVENMREQLQAQISKGQVYVTHSAKELSYMIRNSEFTRRPEAEQQKLVSSVEKEALEFLAKYRNYEYIRIYFLGAGTSGIDNPYICRVIDNACLKIEEQENHSNRVQGRIRGKDEDKNE
jgi:hypothetical protein